MPRITCAFVLLLALSSFNCQGQTRSHQEINALKSAIAQGTYPNIDGILVKKADQVLVEAYFNDFDQEGLHDLRSSFKSITSLLAGIAIDQGLIKLDDPVLKYYPDYVFKDANDQKKALITLRHLLEMRSGLNCEEFYDIGPECEGNMVETKDWVAFCLNVPVKSSPGLNWSYNSNEPMLVGDIIARASGMSIMEFAKRYLFAPLGIENYKWTVSPKGQGMTAGSFYMAPQDMLKIADLVSANGVWRGQQIVSRAWIEASTHCTIDIDFSFVRFSRMANAQHQSAQYGFFWYTERLRYNDIDTQVLFASGNGGQYIMVLPAYNAKVVFTGGNYGNWRGKLPFEILIKYLIPIIAKEA